MEERSLDQAARAEPLPLRAWPLALGRPPELAEPLAAAAPLVFGIDRREPLSAGLREALSASLAPAERQRLVPRRA